MKIIEYTIDKINELLAKIDSLNLSLELENLRKTITDTLQSKMNTDKTELLSKISQLESRLNALESDNPIAPTQYSVTNNLTNITTTNSATTVTANGQYITELYCDDDYDLSSIKVTMNNIDITSSVFSENSEQSTDPE